MHRVPRPLLALAALLLALGAAEVVLHVALRHTSWAALANPEAYFDPLCDDDYWAVLARGAYGASLHRPGTEELDPVLGWVPDRRRLDALGEWPVKDAVSEPKGQQVAIFGDSFVFGTVNDGERLSDHLQRALSDHKVLNFGVGGYGLDQIVLRLEDRASVLNPGDRVLVGILTTDLDRTVLSVRQAPKPRFKRKSDNTLALQTPSASSPHEWFETHEIRPWSLVWTRIQRTVALQSARLKSLPHPECRVEDKKWLAGALVDRVRTLCTAQELHCGIVLFHRPEDLHRPPDWRSETLASLTDKTLPLYDSRDVIQEALDSGVQVYGSDRHPTASGNALLAQWLVEQIPTP